MSLKGVKKAITRTPHQLFGKKTPDDHDIIKWGDDIKMSIIALSYLSKQTKIYIESWRSIFNYNVKFCKLLLELYAPIDVDVKQNDHLDVHGEEDIHSINSNTQDEANLILLRNQKKPYQHASQITMEELGEFISTILSVKGTVFTMLENLESSVLVKTREMSIHLELISKLLIKRNHKKLDYDRYLNNVEKFYNKGINGDSLNDYNDIDDILSERDKNHFKKAQLDLENSTKIFINIDDKIKKIIPNCLGKFTEFLNILTFIYYKTQLDILSIYNENLKKFTITYGLNDKNNNNYEVLSKDWEIQFNKVQRKFESIRVIADGNSIHLPLVKEIEVEKEKKTLNPHKVHFDYMLRSDSNPVKPIDREEGMFTTIADPLGPILTGKTKKLEKKVVIEEEKENDEKYTEPEPARFQKLRSATISNQASWGFFKKPNPLHRSSSSTSLNKNSKPVTITGRKRSGTTALSRPTAKLFKENVPANLIEDVESITEGTNAIPQNLILNSCPITTVFKPHDRHVQLLARALTSNTGSNLMDSIRAMYEFNETNNNHSISIDHDHDNENNSNATTSSGNEEVEISDKVLQNYKPSTFKSIICELNSVDLNYFGTDEESDDSETDTLSGENYDLYATHTFHGEIPGDLSFKEGEKIMLLSTHGDNEYWWYGRTPSGRIGAFPSNFVTFLKEK